MASGNYQIRKDINIGNFQRIAIGGASLNSRFAHKIYYFKGIF